MKFQYFLHLFCLFCSKTLKISIFSIFTPIFLYLPLTNWKLEKGLVKIPNLSCQKSSKIFTIFSPLIYFQIYPRHIWDLYVIHLIHMSAAKYLLILATYIRISVQKWLFFAKIVIFGSLSNFCRSTVNCAFMLSFWLFICQV